MFLLAFLLGRDLKCPFGERIPPIISIFVQYDKTKVPVEFTQDL